MADEKKSKKKGKKGKKEEVVVEEETEYDRMDLEMLREVVPMLEQQLSKSRIDRNYVQLERDSIQQYFDVTKREVTELELALASKEREIEVMENNHRVTLRVYDQKIKSLEYTHKNSLELISSSAESTSLTSTKALDVEKQKLLEKVKLGIQNEQLRLEKENVERIAELKVEHEKYLSKLSYQFDEGLKELTLRCESRKETIETDYELRRRVDVHEVEERKNMHINELINNHKKAFNQMKDYYNKITYENLNLIKSLQGQIRELKSRAEHNKATLLQYKQENDQLTELSAKEAQRMALLQSQLRQRKNDKLALKNALSRQADVEKKLKIAVEEFGKLRDEYISVEREHNELCISFEENISLAQDQSNEMNKALEARLKSLREKSEQTSLEFNHQLSLENKLKQVSEDLKRIEISSSAAAIAETADGDEDREITDETHPPIPPPQPSSSSSSSSFNPDKLPESHTSHQHVHTNQAVDLTSSSNDEQQQLHEQPEQEQQEPQFSSKENENEKEQLFHQNLNLENDTEPVRPLTPEPSIQQEVED